MKIKYNKMIYICLTIIILFILLIIIGTFNFNNRLNYIQKEMMPIYDNNLVSEKSTPMIIMQTYKDKKMIPPQVYDNIKTHASNYKHIVYDDEECIEFLEQNYNNLVVEKFKTLKSGAHKADLFRYCWLYKNGGIWLDIKTILIKDLDDIFTDTNLLYSVKSKVRNSVYQGIISTPPNNPIFKDLINYVLACNTLYIYIDYLIFTRDFYKKLQKVKNYKLFNEICCNKQNNDLELDRYNLKCSINDNDERVFITRYSDYPW